MRSSVAVRSVLAALAALSAASAIHAQSARETVYFTTPNGRISRALFGTSSSQTAVTDNGTNLNGLAARYDGNDVVTLLAANTTQGGNIRAYRCPSPTVACQKLGVVTGFKQANAVALDTFGNAYAVNAQQGGADVLLYMPRKPTCPTTSGTGLPTGCFPGGYGASKTIDSQVNGVTLVADVEVASGSGDVYVLASKPARLLRYSGTAVKSYIDNGGTQPSPTVVSSNFSGQEPAGLALFPTGEVFVVTTQGSVYVFNGTARNTFTTLNSQGVQVAIGVVGGASADPVADGRVLVTVKGSNQVQSFGIQKVGGNLVASPSMPDGTVPANVPFGVSDASLSGAVYTAESAVPLVVKLPIGHEVTFEKVNTGGITEGNYYIVSEAAVRAQAAGGGCAAHEKLTLENVTRCVPLHVRGFSLSGSTCEADGDGCYYLVFVADTGANVFGYTQQHHFEEDDFGFGTTCYDGAGQPFNTPDLLSFNPLLQAGQPRVFQATDDNDAPIFEGKLFTDITTGCNSHIGRGGEFSMFLTGWDDRERVEIIDEKLNNLDAAIEGTTPALGGLDPYITASIKPTLLNKLSAIQSKWALDRVTPTLSAMSATTAKLNAFIAFVKANATTGFTECPGGGSCATTAKRNAPGELISRAESARFFTCGAANGCYSTFP
jgi:hypothetical protein